MKKSKEILEKFSDVLSPEVYAELTESIEALIAEKAKERADMIADEEKKRLEELAEEFCEKEVKDRLVLREKELVESYEAKEKEFKETVLEKYQELANKYVTEQLTEATTKLTSELQEKFESKFEKLEESVLDNLDKFLDSEITSKISDDLLKEIAINEAYKPLIAGIFNLFETNLVGLETTGESKIQELEAEKKSLEKKLNESFEEKIKQHQKIDELKTGLLIASKVDGLTEKQKSRVISMFEGKSYDEVSSKIGTFIEVLEEGSSIFSTPDKPVGTINEDIFSLVVEDEATKPLNETVEDVTDVRFSALENLLRDR